MANIQVLDQITIDKIAAGEVVEKTMNVVKELVENSIDAKSDEIEISLKEKIDASQREYILREKIEIVQDAIKQKKVGLVERRNILKRVMAKLRAIIETFSWD